MLHYLTVFVMHCVNTCEITINHSLFYANNRHYVKITFYHLMECRQHAVARDLPVETYVAVSLCPTTLSNVIYG